MDAYTWGTLGTIAGATAATLLIVQYLKAPLDRWLKIPTRLLVYIIALLILLGAQTALGPVTWIAVPLIALNAFVVAFAAVGAYETSFGAPAKDDKPAKPPGAADKPA